MLWVTAKLCTLDTAILGRLMKFRGNISTVDVSSTNFVRKCQSTNRLFVITANRTTPNLFPWGMPPLKVFHLDKVPPTLTACLQSTKKVEISAIKTLRSIRSKTFTKVSEKLIYGLQGHQNQRPRRLPVEYTKGHLWLIVLYEHTVWDPFFHLAVKVI